MEVEYKWELSSAKDDAALAEIQNHPLVADALANSTVIHMHGVYYDTPDGSLAEKRIGLRLRGENGRFVCCMKCPAPQTEGAAKARKEYEIEAEDIASGVAALLVIGAPVDICDEVLAKGVVVTCETEFDRTACAMNVDVNGEQCTAELAFDMGCMRREGREAPINEIELEYKSGSSEAFHAYAQQLQDQFELQVQPLSKLARALQV